ncbi:MAG: hypothetical protein V1726_06810 [Methanobacteriota archaeon]
MIYRRIICYLGILVLLLGGLTIPIGSANPAVMITSYALSPEVLMPGDTAMLTLTVRNAETTGTRTTVSVDGSSSTTLIQTLGASIDNIWIVPAQSGGRHIRATANYEDLGYLASGASVDVSFKLLVDQNMTAGLYFLTARIDVASYEDVQFPIPVKVSNASVELLATSVPSKISLGGSTEITFTTVNKRDAAVEGVQISPSEDMGFEVVPESVYIGSLAAGASEEVSFAVRPNALGSANLSFDVRFMNGDNEHTKTLVRPMEVIETLDVAPIITSFPLSIQKGGSAKISVEVYNAKTERITGVIVTPVSNATVVPSQYFIGAMDPDDVFSASFDIYTDTVDFGSHTIGFIVTFKQADDFYQTPMVSKSFSVVSGPGTSYQTSSGGTQGSTGMENIPDTGSIAFICVGSIIVIVVVIVVIVLLIRKLRKRRKDT